MTVRGQHAGNFRTDSRRAIHDYHHILGRRRMYHGADSRLYYVAFMVNSADLPAAAYVYDSQYANYSISKDPVYLTLTKSYKVTAVDANNYNSVPGTYYTEL